MSFRKTLRVFIVACSLWALGAIAAATPASAALDYGVTAGPGTSSKDLDRMKQAGVDVLLLGIDWGEVQRAKGGRYDWRRTDDLVLAALERGIEVMPRLYGLPKRGAGEGPRHLRGMPTSGDELRAWRRFVTAAMERYGTTGSIWGRAGDLPAPVAITTWQVSLRLGASGSERTSKQQRKRAAGAYARLVASARRVAEDTDRAAEIAADIEVVRPPGGPDRISASVVGMLARASAVRDSSVTFTLRPRGRPSAGLEHDVERFREVLARIGLGDAQLILAPIGWASDKRLSPSMSVGRRKQATLLRKSFEAADRNRGEWGVHAVIWSAWRDRARRRGCDWCRKSGLLDRLGRPKPSYRAFEALARGSDAEPGEGGAVPEPGGLNDEFWGVHPQSPISDADANGMVDAGVGTSRLSISPTSVQPSGTGPMQWGEYDPIFEQLAERGIRVLPMLLGDTERTDELVATGLPGWKDSVAAVVDRYGSGGAFWRKFSAEHPGVDQLPPTAWQVWNEQNSRGFWKSSLEDYASLLDVSAEAIRTEDSSTKVMLGGMYSYTRVNADDFLRALYEVPGAADDFDVVASHPYAKNNYGIATQIEDLRREMELHGDEDKGLWITEAGWGSVPVDDPTYSHLTLTEPGQAEALDASFRMYLENRAEWRLRGVVWFSWRDGATPVCSWCQHTGLLRNDGSPKPSLAAYMAFANGAAP